MAWLNCEFADDRHKLMPRLDPPNVEDPWAGPEVREVEHDSLDYLQEEVYSYESSVNSSVCIVKAMGQDRHRIAASLSNVTLEMEEERTASPLSQEDGRASGGCYRCTGEIGRASCRERV